jgi:hypothetical protein
VPTNEQSFVACGYRASIVATLQSFVCNREQLDLLLDGELQASVSSDSPELAKRLAFEAAQAGASGYGAISLGNKKGLIAELRKFATSDSGDAALRATAAQLATQIEKQP